MTADERAALSALWSTLDEPAGAAADFPAALSNAVMALARYSTIAEALAPIEGTEAIFYKLFLLLRQAADPIDVGSGDGVLLRSMRTGALQCAGRVLIGSRYLSERGVPHRVARAPGHLFMIAEVKADSIAYSDPNRNLYFTFPRDALRGYSSTEQVTECAVVAYRPRAGEVIDGSAFVNEHFLCEDPEPANLRAYLGNVRAALAGRSEFWRSGIAVSHRAGVAMDATSSRMHVPQHALIAAFDASVDLLAERVRIRELRYWRALSELAAASADEAAFAAGFASLLHCELARAFPYMVGASVSVRAAFTTAWHERCRYALVQERRRFLTSDWYAATRSQ